MAELKLTIKKEQAREMASGAGVDLTDEIYDKLSYAQQLMINLHEKFIGPVKKVGEYEGRHYVRRDELEALSKVFKL